MNAQAFTPRMKPLSARRSAILCVLDVGTSKVACIIARLMPAEPSDLLRGRTHACRVLGIGHQRSRGLKGGVIVDMDEAEKAIRLAVDAAERMAGVQAESLIVNLSGDDPVKFSDAHIGAFANDERKMHKSIIVHRVDGRAISGDDENLAILLPKRVRVTLRDLDHEPVRIELAHACFAQERRALQSLTDLLDVDKGQ